MLRNLGIIFNKIIFFEPYERTGIPTDQVRT